MDSSLHEVWQAAATSPFFPVVNKGSQFWVAFLLLLLGFALTGVFALSRRFSTISALFHITNCLIDRSLLNVPVLGIPASLAIAYAPTDPPLPYRLTDLDRFGVVYMFCAVGVYV